MKIEELIDQLTPRLAQIESEMADSAALTNPSRMRELAREHRRLEELQNGRTQLVRLRREETELREALEDPELAPLAEGELRELETRLTAAENQARRLLLPESPQDARNAVLEIRAGTGGEEAGLFAADLFRMYQRYIELKGWRMQVVSCHFSELGGIKEIIADVSGENIYGRLKYESGVHRVQRVPVTEASGRLHTSAATVAVLPEAEEVEIEIDPGDLKIDTFRSSGPGGQHVNKTDSAIRVTHIPTGMVVTCQDEKSQHKNRAHALKVLRARLYQQALEAEQAKRSQQRQVQVSTGDRSAKIRTYNFPQNRVTDHRVPVTVYRLEEVLLGGLDLILQPLIDYYAEEQLAQVLKTMEN